MLFFRAILKDQIISHSFSRLIGINLENSSKRVLIYNLFPKSDQLFNSNLEKKRVSASIYMICESIRPIYKIDASVLSYLQNQRIHLSVMVGVSYPQSSGTA